MPRSVPSRLSYEDRLLDQGSPQHGQHRRAPDGRGPVRDPRGPVRDPRGPVRDPRGPGGDPRRPAGDPGEAASGPYAPRGYPDGSAGDPRAPMHYADGPSGDQQAYRGYPGGPAADPRREARGPRWEPRDPRGEARDPRQPTRDPRGMRGAVSDPQWQVRDPAGVPRRPSADPRAPRDPEDPRDAQWRTRDPRDPRWPTRNPSDPQWPGRDPRDPGNPHVPRDPADFRDPRRPRGPRDPGWQPADSREPGYGPGGPGGRGGNGHGRGGGPGRPRRQRRHRLRRFFRLRSVRIVLAAFGVFLIWVAWSIGQTLTAPGNTGNLARVAEWMRDHYLGPVITVGEWITYNPPKVGGKPQFSLTAPGGAPAKAGHSAIKPIVPKRLSSPAGSPLPGEGQWRVLASVKGVPAIYGTYLRPDSIHTSYVSGIASMDQRLLKFQLRPGAEDPGPGNWGTTPYIAPGTRTGLLATFNGGFKLNVAGGGFYLNGVSKGTLTQGAASLVFYKNGRVTVGQWGRDVNMSSQVTGVRQNLRLIVDHGAVPSSVDQNVESQWGATLGGAYDVWRSGIGITRDGRIVYVYGPALSVRSLADLLQRAGAVEGMQLDINPAWMSYMTYKPSPSAANPTPTNLLPNQPEPANRYYSVNSRDFTAVYAR